ncbi:MAG: immunoglobulin domain-containing protein [Steroidobacteraceae bacterium]
MIRKLARSTSWLVVATLFTACGGGSGGGAGDDPAPVTPPPPPAATAPVITTQPTNVAVTVGKTATFTVVASGTEPMTYQWQRNGTAIAGATAASYTTPTVQITDDGAMFAVVVTNSSGNATSTSAKLSVAAVSGPGPSASDVVTFKYDIARTGQYLVETTLTPANVNSTSFGLLRHLKVDGKVDAQPLYLSQLTVGGSAHNVVFVATEHASVYAFDADSGAVLWQKSMLGSGEKPSGEQGCTQVTPEIGITSTPVIDRTAGPNGTIYVVAMSFDSASKYHQRLHALDVTTGAELLNGPTEITATYPNAGGTTTFDPGQYEERAALLLTNGLIYTAWTSHCDAAPYSGWVIAFKQTDLTRASVLNVAPNSGASQAGGNGFSINGPAIWMSGAGPGADAAGNVYLLTGNGRFETALDAKGFPNQGDYGNSFVKIANSNGTLSVADYFSMSNTVAESMNDQDLGSGGELLLPDLTDSTNTVKHLVVGAGKDRIIYVVDRDNMGKFNGTKNNIWQQLDTALGGQIRSSPAYFNGNLYYGPVNTTLKAFSITNAKLSTTATSQSAATFGYPGASPIVSANGTTNGIVWVDDNSNTAVTALRAYDATNLAHELYNSNQATGSRDQFGAGNKFITPMVTSGKVFVGSTTEVAVFGLLH